MKAIFPYLRQDKVKKGMVCDGPTVIADYLKDKLSNLLVEQFWCILLDVKNRIIGEVLVAQGSMTACVVHPREVFLPAVVNSAAHIIVGHNHPSGNPSPSVEDNEMTRRLKDSGELLGIPMLDHIIVGTEGYYSFTESSAF